LWPMLPMMFDLFTVVLLVSGFLLLWRNLRAPTEDVLPTVRGDPEAAESHVPRAELIKTKDIVRVDNGALLNADPIQQPDAQADAVSTNRNHFASSVSAAIAKSRKPSVSV
jgi:hypothetical protein